MSFLFMVLGPFLFEIEHWNRLSTSSSTDAARVALVTEVPALLKKTSKEQATLKAAAQKPSRMRKQRCLLTVDEKKDGQLESDLCGRPSHENGIEITCLCK